MGSLPFEIFELAMHPEAPSNDVTHEIDPAYRAIVRLIEPLKRAQANFHPGELTRLLDGICVGDHAYRIRFAMRVPAPSRFGIHKARSDAEELPENRHPQSLGQGAIVEISRLVLPKYCAHEDKDPQRKAQYVSNYEQHIFEMGEQCEADERGRPQNKEQHQFPLELGLSLQRKRIGNRVKSAPQWCEIERACPGIRIHSRSFRMCE